MDKSTWIHLGESRFEIPGFYSPLTFGLVLNPPILECWATIYSVSESYVADLTIGVSGILKGNQADAELARFTWVPLGKYISHCSWQTS